MPRLLISRASCALRVRIRSSPKPIGAGAYFRRLRHPVLCRASSVDSTGCWNALTPPEGERPGDFLAPAHSRHTRNAVLHGTDIITDDMLSAEPFVASDGKMVVFVASVP